MLLQSRARIRHIVTVFPSEFFHQAFFEIQPAYFKGYLLRHGNRSRIALMEGLVYRIKNSGFLTGLASLVWGQKDIPHILLLHHNSPAALWGDALLTRFRNKGVQFINAKKAISDPFYYEDTTYSGPVGSSFILQALVTRRIRHNPQKNYADLLASICQKI